MDIVQTIDGGNDNIQATGDVSVTKNYFIGYQPEVIRFYEKDICIVIDAFKEYADSVDTDIEVNSSSEFELIGKPEKNEINNLSEDYFKTICDDYLPYFKKIADFLRAPQNKIYLDKYIKTAFQLNFQIAVIRKRFNYFEEVLNAILGDIIANETSELVEDIDKLILFMNFMYWHCDIGRRN